MYCPKCRLDFTGLQSICPECFGELQEKKEPREARATLKIDDSLKFPDIASILKMPEIEPIPLQEEMKAEKDRPAAIESPVDTLLRLQDQAISEAERLVEKGKAAAARAPQQKAKQKLATAEEKLRERFPELEKLEKTPQFRQAVEQAKSISEIPGEPDLGKDISPDIYTTTGCKTIAATILSFCIPGTGQFLLGKIGKGILMLIFWIAFIGMAQPFFIFALMFGSAIDAYSCGKKQERGV